LSAVVVVAVGEVVDMVELADEPPNEPLGAADRRSVEDEDDKDDTDAVDSTGVS
jgi:hypothetical protein